MKFFCRHVCGVIVVALVLLGAPRAALAACTSPDGIGGTITWNGTDSVIWCDGTTWYALKNAASAAGSTGQVQFNGGSGAFSADTALTWDNTNKRLGIGTATPRYSLHVGAGSGTLGTYNGNGGTTFTPQIVAQPTSGVAGVGAFVNNGTNNRAAALFMNDTDTLWGLSQANSSGGAVPFIIRQYSIGEVLRIDSNGNVGIGTTTPLSPLSFGTGIIAQKLNLYETALKRYGFGIQSGEMRTYIESDTNARLTWGTIDNADGTTWSEKMRLTASGNVGIGTTSPSYLLSLGGEAARTIGMERTSAGTTGYALTLQAGGAKSATADLNGGDLTLSSGIATGTGSSNIYFKTAAAGATGTANRTPGTAMTILGNNNVGIGITTPVAALHVSGTDNTAYATSSSAADGPAFLSSPTAPMVMIGNIGNTDGQGAYLSFLTRNSAANGQRAYIGAISNTAGRAPTIVFGQQTALAAYAERMRIASSGNVGIGTTSPSYLLSLDGEAARAIGMERTSAGTNGYGLTLQAGGAKSATADLNGGDITLSSGTATGTGSSNIYFKTAAAGATGTADRTPGTAMTILGNNNVGIGTTSPSYSLHVGSTGTLTAFNGNAGNTFTPQIVAQPSSGVAGVGAFVVNGTNNRRAALFMNDTDTLWGLSQANSSGGAVPFVIRQYSTGEVLRIDSNGNVGIGTSTPAAKLDVAGNAAFSGNVFMGRTTASASSTPAGLTIQHLYGVNYGLVLVSDNAGASSVVRFDNPNGNVGSIVVTGTTTTYTTSSDRRLKENITDATGALENAMRIPVRNFSFKSDPTHQIQTGFIAQEVAEEFPEAVVTNGDDGTSPLEGDAKAWSVDYGRLTPLLLKAVQELKAANDNLQATVEAQGAEIEALKAAVQQ